MTIENLLELISARLEASGQLKTALEASTPLVREGYLDSFSVADVIADLESKYGHSLDLALEDFESVATLHQRLHSAD